MSKVLNTKRTSAPPPPGFPAAFRALAVLFLGVLVFGGASSTEAADQDGVQPVHRFHLQAGLSGLVDSEGGLTFQPAGSTLPVLWAELTSLGDSRRRRNADTFSAVVTEGVEGGHRGFSTRADDDQDGRFDEDPLDGIDNDVDGSIDEDFAAISDAMVAVHLNEPGKGRGSAGLEYYHWATPRMSSAVFLNAGGGPQQAGRGSYRIRSSGATWLEAETRALRHTVAGRPAQDGLKAVICRVSLEERPLESDPCGTGENLWLGVMVLDEDSATRLILDGDRIDLPLGNKAVPLVVCAADSWLQLNRILGEARSVYQGMTDPVDNRRVRWIVPPGCSACRTAGPLDFDLTTHPDGGATLATDIAPGQCGLLDPDLFRVGDRPLGAPREIRWFPAGGKETVVSWGCLNEDRLQDGASASAANFTSFSDLLGHEARGRLEFIFAPSPDALENEGPGDPVTRTEVVGRYLDGRPLRSFLGAGTPDEEETGEDIETERNPEQPTVEEVARGYAEDRARLLQSGRYHPSLSPALLIGWPNPFNDVISIGFTVPRTMKEAFIWKDDEEQPLEIDLAGDVPWSGGQPSVSVKIYSINGQELVTLHSATESAGEYTVQWNGTDAFGRKVASGTYFCKLQMDDWSLTRRLVFIR